MLLDLANVILIVVVEWFATNVLWLSCSEWPQSGTKPQVDFDSIAW